MSRIGWFERLKGWFRGSSEAAEEGWTIHSAGAGLALAGAGAGLSDAARLVTTPETDKAAAPRLAAGAPRATVDAPPESPDADPLVAMPDPEWLDRLADLPERIAGAVSQSAVGAKALARIASELDGHRATGDALAESVTQLPDLAAAHAQLVRETNTLLEHQNRLTETVLETLGGLRGTLGTVEETGRRHLACLAHLEANHRQVLELYQTTLLASHRRLGRMALFAAMLGVAALTGVGYLVYLTLAP